jgi:hypothetical protein
LYYTVTPIPLWGVLGVNSQNVVVGSTATGYAAEWNPANNQVTILPMPAGATNDGGTAYAINSSGQVVGDYYNGASYQPFFYDPVTGSVNISVPGLLQGQNFVFNALNDSGTYVGYSDSTFTLITGNAGGVETLSGLGTLLSADGINNAGTIVGSTVECVAYPNCQDVSLIYPNTYIPPFVYGNPGNFVVSGAVAINNNGLVLGNAGQAGAYLLNGYAYVYDPTSDSLLYLAQDYFGQHPGTLDQVYPGGINDAGDIVGLGTGGGSISYGFGHGVLLNHLVASNWNITDAYSISNSGGILATGYDSQTDTFNYAPYDSYVLLEPTNIPQGVPEPGTASGMVLGLAGTIIWARFLARQRGSAVQKTS